MTKANTSTIEKFPELETFLRGLRDDVCRKHDWIGELYHHHFVDEMFSYAMARQKNERTGETIDDDSENKEILDKEHPDKARLEKARRLIPPLPDESKGNSGGNNDNTDDKGNEIRNREDYLLYSVGNMEDVRVACERAKDFFQVSFHQFWDEDATLPSENGMWPKLPVNRELQLDKILEFGRDYDIQLNRREQEEESRKEVASFIESISRDIWYLASTHKWGKTFFTLPDSEEQGKCDAQQPVEPPPVQPRDQQLAWIRACTVVNVQAFKISDKEILLPVDAARIAKVFANQLMLNMTIRWITPESAPPGDRIVPAMEEVEWVEELEEKAVDSIAPWLNRLRDVLPPEWVVLESGASSDATNATPPEHPAWAKIYQSSDSSTVAKQNREILLLRREIVLAQSEIQDRLKDLWGRGAEENWLDPNHDFDEFQVDPADLAKWCEQLQKIVAIHHVSPDEFKACLNWNSASSIHLQKLKQACIAGKSEGISKGTRQWVHRHTVNDAILCIARTVGSKYDVGATDDEKKIGEDESIGDWEERIVQSIARRAFSTVKDLADVLPPVGPWSPGKLGIESILESAPDSLSLEEGRRLLSAHRRLRREPKLVQELAELWQVSVAELHEWWKADEKLVRLQPDVRHLLDLSANVKELGLDGAQFVQHLDDGSEHSKAIKDNTTLRQYGELCAGKSLSRGERQWVANRVTTTMANAILDEVTVKLRRT